MRANMVEDPKNRTWSSYRPTGGIDNAPPFLSAGWILRQFGTEKKRAQKLYALFVKEGITRESLRKNLKGEIFLAEGCRNDRSERDKAVARAAACGCTLKEIAGHLNVHYSTVSRALKRA
ncbi:MAG: helix-turn-helix domain-containing protein [Syntrophorhabdaceae bacterium]|nr:helix-turn-helix domain-containing protein [Syntrophorhabdaceae bacterium]